LPRFDSWPFPASARPFSLLTPALGSAVWRCCRPLKLFSLSLQFQFQLLEHTSVSAGPLPSAIASCALLVASRTLDSVRSCSFYYVTLTRFSLFVSAISSFDIRQLNPRLRFVHHHCDVPLLAKWSARQL
jgi:hypothetical protein